MVPFELSKEVALIMIAKLVSFVTDNQSVSMTPQKFTESKTCILYKWVQLHACLTVSIYVRITQSQYLYGHGS